MTIPGRRPARAGERALRRRSGSPGARAAARVEPAGASAPVVLDASALLAFLFREDGCDRVAPLLARACVSAVNLSEVLGRFARQGCDPRVALARLHAATRLELVPFDRVQAAVTAALIPVTAHLGLSLGDRACLALAMCRKLPAVTADREWARLDIGVEIQVIR